MPTALVCPLSRQRLTPRNSRGHAAQPTITAGRHGSAMTACLPARMGGGGKTPIDALARASGRSPPHGGVYWGLGTRGQSPWRSPQRIAAAIRSNTAPLHGAKPPDALRAGQVGQRASGNERGKCACGSATKTPRPQERAARNRARPPGTPAPLAPLLIVTRMGWDCRPGPRQRIEQVARRAAPKSPHRLRDKMIRRLVRLRACQQESEAHRRCT